MNLPPYNTQEIIAILKYRVLNSCLKYDSAVTITTTSASTTHTTSSTTTNNTNTTAYTSSSSSSSAVGVYDISSGLKVEISTIKRASATQHHRNQYTMTDINIYNKIIEYGIQKLIVYTTDISILSQMIVSIANMIKRYRCLTPTTTTSTHAATPTTIVTPITSITPAATSVTTTTTSSSSSSGIEVPSATSAAITSATPITTAATSTDAPGIGVDVSSITTNIVHICIKALFQSTGVAVTLPLPPHFNTTLMTTTDADPSSSSSSTALTTATATSADNRNSSGNHSNTNNHSSRSSSSSSSSNSSGGSKVLLANLMQSLEEYSKGKMYYSIQ